MILIRETRRLAAAIADGEVRTAGFAAAVPVHYFLQLAWLLDIEIFVFVAGNAVGLSALTRVNCIVGKTAKVGDSWTQGNFLIRIVGLLVND